MKVGKNLLPSTCLEVTGVDRVLWIVAEHFPGSRKPVLSGLPPACTQVELQSSGGRWEDQTVCLLPASGLLGFLSGRCNKAPHVRDPSLGWAAKTLNIPPPMSSWPTGRSHNAGSETGPVR